MPAIEVNNLCRTFEYYEKESGLKGSIKNLFNRKKKICEAVKDVSFSINSGDVVGFLGPNGSGKTTTIKMLSGILHPTSGNVNINGFVPWERKDEFKRSFALVAGQKSQLWMDLPAIDSINLNKCIYEIPDDEFKRNLKELSELLEVDRLMKIQVRRLSLGERMKMELIVALLHRPKVIFLDEPTIGLDIISQQNIRDYLKSYNKSTGATIILTSHYIKDIENLCNKTIVISGGKKVFDGEFGELKKINAEYKQIFLSMPKIVQSGDFEQYGEILNIDKNEISLKIKRKDVNKIIMEILEKYQIEDFNIDELPIENSIELIYNRKV